MLGVGFERRATIAAGARRTTPTASSAASRSTRTRAWTASATSCRRYEKLGIKAATAFPAGLHPAGADQRQEVLSRSTPSASSSTSRSASAPACPARGCRSRCQNVELHRRGVLVLPRAEVRDAPRLRAVGRPRGEADAQVAEPLLLDLARSRRSTTRRTIIDFANTRGADKVMYAGYFPMGLSLERIFTEHAGRAVPRPRVAEVPARERGAGVQAGRVSMAAEPRSRSRCRSAGSSVGYPDDLADRRDEGALLLRPPPRGLARRRRRAPRAGRVLPAPRRPPRPRRHGRGLRDRVPVPRLEVRRRGPQHRHPYSERTNRKARVRTYPVVERNGLVLAWYHPDDEAADVGGRRSRRVHGDDSEWSTDIRTRYVVEAAWQEMARERRRLRPLPLRARHRRRCPRSRPTRPTATGRRCGRARSS